ncbi:peptidase U32 family protein [Candidatus Omnitrophota bacterium]
MLKITAPFKETKEVSPLIAAGANELYCGYLSPAWVARYTSLEFERKGGASSFTDLAELKQAVNLAHKKGIPVYLALNGLYVRQQYPLLLEIIKQLSKVELDGYIVADLGLLLILRDQGVRQEIHVSTGGTVFNSETARFYKNLGAGRVILDRQTTLESMQSISQENPDIDFEVFILNTLCVYIDGYCTFLHAYPKDSIGDISRKEWPEDQKLQLLSTIDPEAMGDACKLQYQVQVFGRGSGNKIDSDCARPTFYKQLIDGAECGACALYDITKTKIRSIKIVGRQLTSEIRLRSTEFIKNVLDILNNSKGISRGDFICRVQKLYRETHHYSKICRGNNCYYPSALGKGGRRRSR